MAKQKDAQGEAETGRNDNWSKKIELSVSQREFYHEMNEVFLISILISNKEY